MRSTCMTCIYFSYIYVWYIYVRCIGIYTYNMFILMYTCIWPSRLSRLPVLFFLTDLMSNSTPWIHLAMNQPVASYFDPMFKQSGQYVTVTQTSGHTNVDTSLTKTNPNTFSVKFFSSSANIISSIVDKQWHCAILWGPGCCLHVPCLS